MSRVILPLAFLMGGLFWATLITAVVVLVRS